MKKNNTFWLHQFIFLGVVLIIASNCKKDDKNNGIPPKFGMVTDIDGNVYKTVTIGNQEWMAENLKVTRYRNGDSIPNTTGASWLYLTTGSYCDFDNSLSKSATYGKLYNWYAVDDYRQIAPTGWHIPSHSEWDILIDYLGGLSVAGGKLKEKGTIHWKSPNNGASNESFFTALPGGYRGNYASFWWIGECGGWWSSSELTLKWAWGREILFDGSDVNIIYHDKFDGFSVRCIKD
jgi:uncharacterized protein (TIGR02145 family)